MIFKKITAVHLGSLYDAKLESLSPRSVNYIHVTMSKALKYAVGKDLLRRNVSAWADARQRQLPLIRRLKAIRAQARLVAGRHWNERQFVFTGERGRRRDPHHLYRCRFIPLRDLADAPPIHCHDLRHTYVTLALLNSVPVKVFSETLGHKDSATTLRIYAHVLPGMQRQAAKTFDSVLF